MAFVAPDSFNVFLSITFLVGIVVGGLASIPGAIFGALFIQFVPNYAQEISKAAPWAIYGVFLIAFMYVMPDGVVGFLRRVIAPARLALWPGSDPHRPSHPKEGSMHRHRSVLALVLTAALVLVAGPALGGRPRRDRHRDQARQHQPLQRSGLRLRHHRQVHRRLLQEGQRGRRHQRPQDQLRHARRRLQPAQGGGDGPEARRAGPGAAPLPDARHAVEQRHLEVHERRAGAAALRGHRGHEVGRPEGPSLDDGLAAHLPGRRAHLRPVRAQERPGRQDRDPLPERRLRQGLPQGIQGQPRPRRQERSCSSSRTRSRTRPSTPRS